MPHQPSPIGPALEAELALLDSEMPHLQARHQEPFALANAWAQRYEAILRETPPELVPEMQRQLQRLGIRWGMMPGARVTMEFPALVPTAAPDRDSDPET